MLQTKPFNWEINQLIKAGLFSDEQEVIRSAMRAMFQTYPEIKKKMVIHAYITGEISLGKAAQIMGVSHEEMKDIIVENGLKIHLGSSTIRELTRDISNA